MSAKVSTRNGNILLMLSTRNIKILNTPLGSYDEISMYVIPKIRYEPYIKTKKNNKYVLFLSSCPPSYAGADELSAGKYSYLVCKTVGLMTTLRENFPSVLFSSIFISIGNLPGQSEN